MTGLVAVLVVLAMAPGLQAQVSITVTPNVSAGEIQTNRGAQTATTGSSGAGVLITGQLIASSPLTTTTLRLAYPSPITSSTAATTNIPSVDPIRIEGATGVFAAVGLPTVNTVASRVEVVLPGFGSSNPNTQSGSFRVVGVRLDANGKVAPVNVTPSLNDNTANYLLVTTSATVINALSPGIASMQVGSRSGSPNLGTATIFTNRTVPDDKASFTITEGFATAFRSLLQESNSGVPLSTTGYNSTRIRLTFANVPTGVTLTLSMNFPDSSGNSTQAKFGTEAAGTDTATITSTTPTATIVILASSLSAVENLEVDISAISVSSTATVTSASTITVTSTLSPICDTIITDTGVPTTANGYPCFAQADNGPVTIVNIVPTNTTMLMPYAAVIPPFDTGLALANTSADPFGGTGGGGAVPSAGTVRLDFFPTASTGGAGTPFSLTTSATVRPGAGLSSDGSLAAGATWTVLFSQLLSAAGQTGNFIGYVFIQANFLNGHGTATISDFRTYSLTSNVLVLLPPATSARSAPIGGAENLNY